MAKYSTDSNPPDPDDEDSSCTMCGSTDKLKVKNVSGANVVVCKECAKSSITQNINKKEKNDKDSSETKKSETNNKYDQRYLASNPDSSWVEKDRADYGNVDTPYMLPNYKKKINKEMDNTDLDKEDICENIDISKVDLESVCNGEVLQNDVSESVIQKIEDYFKIELRENI